jgi:hypothetical protein
MIAPGASQISMITYRRAPEAAGPGRTATSPDNDPMDRTAQPERACADRARRASASRDHPEICLVARKNWAGNHGKEGVGNGAIRS